MVELVAFDLTKGSRGKRGEVIQEADMRISLGIYRNNAAFNRNRRRCGVVAG